MEENWFLIGDIHGEVWPIELFCKNRRYLLDEEQSKNHLILLGDVGCNYFANQNDNSFKEELSRFPLTYVCLRGNHEARVSDVIAKYPEAWERVEKYGGIIYREKQFPSIEYLEDIPAIYDFGGYKTLSIPGAYSVDKWYRIRNHWQWYMNEQLSEDEMQLGRELVDQHKSIDLIISHTCPISYEPRDLFLAEIDQSMVDKTMERYLDEIENVADYRKWCWGHYHETRLYGDKRKLMLFNNHIVGLEEFMEMSREQILEDIVMWRTP